MPYTFAIARSDKLRLAAATVTMHYAALAKPIALSRNDFAVRRLELVPRVLHPQLPTIPHALSGRNVPGLGTSPNTARRLIRASALPALSASGAGACRNATTDLPRVGGSARQPAETTDSMMLDYSRCPTNRSKHFRLGP